MSICNIFRIAGLALFVVAGSAQAGPRTVTDPERPRQLEGDDRVAVSWDDPKGFTELRYSGNRWEAERGNWVEDLARYLQRRADKTLPAGQRMEVHITDIDRAGDYEPGRGLDFDRIRMMRNVYPPRLSFSFTRYGADGQVVDQGERELTDQAYLLGYPIRHRNDPLRYEKRMVDRWVQRELKASGA